MTRVLVVEDSAVSRELLVNVLGRDPELSVVGAARDGEEAIRMTERLRPDVVLMDIHMPKLDGYEATSWIMQHVPTPIVMISAYAKSEASLALEALRVGALTLLAKPPALDHPDHASAARELVETVRLMADVKVVRRRAARRVSSAQTMPRVDGERGVRIVAMGASTGGPKALATILRDLPPDVDVPILVVQHIAPGFVAGLASWLSGQTPLAVKVAGQGEPASPRTVYLAPDHAQMGIGRGGRIQLVSDLPVNGPCPSISYLFQSIAKAYGASALGVLLSGMGADGAEGLLRLHEAGALTIAQDEETCVVFGMPRAAIRLGAAKHVLTPTAVAGTIRTLGTRAVGGSR
jgi:two-component system, chemotaxis family, protein-glutamate methylesterase/glutaminase